MENNAIINRRTALRKKKRASVNKGPKEEPKEKETKIIPEQSEENNDTTPDEKTEETNEIKPKGTEHNENRP